MNNNQIISSAFVTEMKNRGISLDYSEASLDKLDNFIEGNNKTERKLSIDFVEKLGAYLTQIIMMKTGATWSFSDSEELPSVRVGGITVTPIARVLKALDQSEKLGVWYKMKIKMVPLLESSRSQGAADN